MGMSYNDNIPALSQVPTYISLTPRKYPINKTWHNSERSHQAGGAKFTILSQLLLSGARLTFRNISVNLVMRESKFQLSRNEAVFAVKKLFSY